MNTEDYETSADKSQMDWDGKQEGELGETEWTKEAGSNPVHAICLSDSGTSDVKAAW